MTIADIFAALTEDRPYRAGLSKERAMDIIAQGIHTVVDEQLVKVAANTLL
jgi:HD-GYP domain-containing protein (c-di-GMP phosphodiesterase class II)